MSILSDKYLERFGRNVLSKGMGKKANDEEETGGKAPSQDAVIKFLDRHPNPTDDQFHEWAESQGYNTHKAEQVAYRILSDIINKGESKGKVPSGVTPKMVAEGVKVEKEHTPNPLIARKITLDHQTEHKEYYPALKKMERRLEKKAFMHGFLDEIGKAAYQSLGGGAIAAGGFAYPKKDKLRGGAVRTTTGTGTKTITGGKMGDSPTRPALSPKTGLPKGLKKIAGPPTLAKLRKAYPKGRPKVTVKNPKVADPTAAARALPTFPKAATVSGRAKYLLKRLAAPIRRIMAEHKSSKAMDEGKLRKAMRYGGVSAGLGPSFGREPKKAKRLVKDLEAATAKA